MNRIDTTFRRLNGTTACIVYITAGDPNLAATARIAVELERAGVDILELGIPFSDPVADGPTIQAASHRALAGGVTLRKILRMAKTLRPRITMPVVFMTYYNPVFHYGVEKFMRDAGRAGVDGIIIPDLPYEESAALGRAARRHKIATILLVAPTSPVARIRKIVSRSSGFVYYVSLRGVTGARRTIPPETGRNIRQVKRCTRLPVCVGFGISTPAQAQAVARIADGVIVGSAVVSMIGRFGKNFPRLKRELIPFTQRLAKAVHRA